MLAIAIGYLWICDRISRKWPRVGKVLLGVIVAGLVALFVGILGAMFAPHVVLYLLPPAYVIALVVWVFSALTEKLPTHRK